MENLVYIAWGALVVGLISLGGGLWLVHVALNAGNPWQGIVGIAVAVFGLILTVSTAKAL
jgi:hypothetical protein